MLILGLDLRDQKFNPYPQIRRINSIIIESFIHKFQNNLTCETKGACQRVAMEYKSHLGERTDECQTVQGTEAIQPLVSWRYSLEGENETQAETQFSTE
jgi:hypothetical protein